MLKVKSGWLLGISVHGLRKREMYPCTVLSPISFFSPTLFSLMQSLLIRSLIALLSNCALGEVQVLSRSDGEADLLSAIRRDATTP